MLSLRDHGTGRGFILDAELRKRHRLPAGCILLYGCGYSGSSITAKKRLHLHRIPGDIFSEILRIQASGSAARSSGTESTQYGDFGQNVPLLREHKAGEQVAHVLLRAVDTERKAALSRDVQLRFYQPETALPPGHRGPGFSAISKNTKLSAGWPKRSSS